MSGLFDEGKVFGRPSGGRRQGPPKALIPTIVIVIALLVLGSTFTGVWTDRMWFRAIDYVSVFNTMILTRVLLFTVFGVVLAGVVTLNIVLAYRARPVHRMLSPEQRGLDRYRDVVEPIKRLVVGGVAVLLFFFAGSSATSQWESFMLWRNGGSFGKQDATFNIDIGFFVFDYPFLRYVMSFLFVVVVLAIIGVAVTHYLYGGISLQSRTEKVSSAARLHLSVLIGVFMLLKAVAYWLDRYGLVLQEGDLFTGITYTGEHAMLPAKNILTIIAVLCAILFFVNVIMRGWLLPGLGLGLLVLSAVLLGGVWPLLVQQFQVQPSEPDREGPYIERNIAATREAYGVADVRKMRYSAETTLSREQLRGDAEDLPGVRLVDPTLVQQAFEQLQQVRGFYQVPRTLDVDRYEVDGQKRDMVVGLRELNLNGLQPDQRNWNNDHTVYTHGFGMIAAYGNERTPEGEPVWAERNLPPQGVLGDYEPRVYYGELLPSYSIVGSTEGQPPVELDIPEVEGEQTGARKNTYQGAGGVPMGGFFGQLLYSAEFREPNIMLSSRVNENSKIIYERHPRDRVQKVAPWLTVDGDPYPAVVDGRIVWIVDGYTTSNSYPMSDRRSLDEATATSLTRQPTIAAQPADNLNYMRNSVKAIVDAHSGNVTLYEWNTGDPVLDAWQSAFPGTVKPRDQVPEELLDHVRYPEDLFKVQRDILASYHVTNPSDWYQGNNRWTIPSDPTEPGSRQPPYYLSLRMPDQNQPFFSLNAVYVPQNREILAGLMSVNAEASSDDYGTIRILELPATTQVQGPGQVENAFRSDEGIAQQLLPFQQREGARAMFGNLLTLPVGDGLLYVQPVYTQRGEGQGNYPVLSFVLASFGDEVGWGSNLGEALDRVLGEESGVPSGDGEGGGADGGDGGQGDGGEQPPAGGNEQVAQLLNQASQRFQEADQALANNDLAAYQQAINEARDLIRQAMQIQQAGGSGDGGGDGGQQGDGGGDSGGGDSGGGDSGGGGSGGGG